jgi:sugar lactone lactonase YvrE
MSVASWSATVASDAIYGLGEGPYWDAPRSRVLWVDIDAGTVHEGRLDGDRVVPVRSTHVDGTAGAVVCSADGELLVAGAQRLFPGGPVTSGPRRLNDGACDPAGRFLVGTLPLGGSGGAQSLVRVERDGSVTVLDDDLVLSNGLAWSVDGTRMYSADTRAHVVRVRAYDAGTGEVGPRRDWLRLGADLPDGLCVDAEDHVWVALWGSGRVCRYTPDGELVGVVDVPAPATTSVAFVGDDLRTLLITTATAEVGAADLVAFPDSGRLFVAHVGVAGQPVTPWTGP